MVVFSNASSERSAAIDRPVQPFLGLRLSIPARREDELSEVLDGWPVLGADVVAGEGGTVVATVYLQPSDTDAAEGLARALQRRLLQAPEWLVIEPRDWLAAYRESASPFAVGRSWWIEPRCDSASVAPDGRIRLIVEPRSAFGSGTHESTRLILQALESMNLDGLEVLDVGTGSGILAIAAERLGARTVVAVDIDDSAVWVARHTARQQQWSSKVHFVAGPVSCLSHRSFNLALCNMVSSSFLPLVSELHGLLGDGGRAVFSGLLEVERSSVVRELERSGFTVTAASDFGEWVCLETVVRL
jgi:ribosomal protein L11 methyltransferase